MRRVGVAAVLAAGVCAGGIALWQLSDDLSAGEIDAHLRAQASNLRNEILREIRNQEPRAERVIETIRSNYFGGWAAALSDYPAPLQPSPEAEADWLAARLSHAPARTALPKNTAFGFHARDNNRLVFTQAGGGVFDLPEHGAGLYAAAGNDRIWYARPTGTLAPAPLASSGRNTWVAVELDEAWFTDLALKTRATLAVIGPRGVMRSQGPTDVVAGLIDKLAKQGAPPLFTNVQGGTAGARVELNGNLALLAMAAETNEVRLIEKRYSQGRLLILAGSGACLLLLLLWVAVTSRSRSSKRSPAPAAESLELAHTTEVELRAEQRLSGSASTPGARHSDLASRPPSAPMPIAVASPPPGNRLGRYELLAPIGEGGMAEIFSAVSFGLEGFRRVFVLKRLKPHLISHEGVVGQFIDEAKLAASLQHTNILSVMDFGCECDQYFMVTDYVWGRNVGQVIDRAKERGLSAIPADLALYFTHELLQGLAYAHTQVDADGFNRHIVHRDVSVNNVMVSTEGVVKLLDFGIAKAYERSSHTTEQGVIKGNILYMSPEQAQGLHVDHRSDIFSAALVLLSMITGQAPYKGTSQFKVLMEAARGPQDLNQVLGQGADPHFVAMLRRALHADPEQRYQTAAEFAEEMRAFPMADRFAAAQFMAALFGDQLEQEKRDLDAIIRALPEPEDRISSGSMPRVNTA